MPGSGSNWGVKAERRRKARATGPPGHLLRSERWAGLRPGDAVEVAGSRRGSAWTYVAHVRNTVSGEEWVEVVGGRPGAHDMRSFRLEQIHAPGAKGPSLADAPRLPFG